MKLTILTDNHAAPGLACEHGFAAMIETSGKRILFDTGQLAAFDANCRALGIDLSGIDMIVLSHGHFDHVVGLNGVLDRLGPRRTPVILHPDFWLRRRIVVPGRDPFELPVTDRVALAAVGFEVVEHPQPSVLLDGSLLVTGEVPRTTEFETGFPIHQAFRDGGWTPDPLIRDDQAVVAHVRGKGLVVLTGCGHAGIVNIVRHARALTGVDAADAVIGGFHLSGPLFEPIIPAAVEALAEIGPQVVVPAHCTGWRAVQELSLVFPDAFIPPSVGTRYDL
jgi:7,8-dihydropterin-6-yl-methyl-4-(beta-D-ribofuranosyl)aminobenzene 5'-phosphate synthase